MTDLEIPGQTDSPDHTVEADQKVAEITASRALAVDRVIKGGSLAALGMGAAFAVSSFSVTTGPLFWIGICTAVTALGGGSLWAGLGASHLLRYGKKGSSLGLISLAGLGGSLLLQVFTFNLNEVWAHPILTGLNLVSKAISGLFVAVLLIIGIITVVRWMIPGSGSAGDDGD